jgi:chemotaxis response regulator CheB
VLVLCIARHVYLSEHIARFFARVGAITETAVGLDEGARHALECRPDVVLCEYDLLATLPLDAWEDNEPLSRLPILAVSLTRRPGEAHLFDVNNISGFLYLPTLSDEKAHQVLVGAARTVVRAPAQTPLSWASESGHSTIQPPI